MQSQAHQQTQFQEEAPVRSGSPASTGSISGTTVQYSLSVSQVSKVIEDETEDNKLLKEQKSLE